MQCHLQHLCSKLWYRLFGKTNSLSKISITQNMYYVYFHTPNLILVITHHYIDHSGNENTTSLIKKLRFERRLDQAMIHLNKLTFRILIKRCS